MNRANVLMIIMMAAAAIGCSRPAASGGDAATAPCVAAQCLAGNICADGTCSLPCQRHADCAEDQGQHCVPGVADRDGGSVLVCRAGAVPRLPGREGAPCGIELDNDCDVVAGYVCLGRKNDLDAFCTLINGCTSDTQCPSGMTCGNVRQTGCVGLTPCTAASDCAGFVGSTCRPYLDGKSYCIREQSCHTVPDDCPLGVACQPLPGTSTRYAQARACIPRGDCSPCASNLDCLGSASLCVADRSGARFCSRPCQPDGTSCDPGAACQPTPEGNACIPRSGSCAGSRTACASCRDDTDCSARGSCETIALTRERYCVEPCGGADGTTCPTAPGGSPMYCCTSGNCGLNLNRCLPLPHANPYQRWSTGCWLRPCQKNGDCEGGQLCDIRSESLVSETNLLTQCGAQGVCRPPRDPTDAVDFPLSKRVCDCAGNMYASEAELTINPAAAFRGCCITVMTTSGASYSCPTP